MIHPDGLGTRPPKGKASPFQQVSKAVFGREGAAQILPKLPSIARALSSDGAIELEETFTPLGLHRFRRKDILEDPEAVEPISPGSALKPDPENWRCRKSWVLAGERTKERKPRSR